MKARRPHAVTTGVVVRSLRPTDRTDVQDLHERMDQHDAYLRFFGARPKHLEDLAESLCRQDPGRCALGAFIGGILVGVANYVSPADQSDNDSPLVEFGLVVDHEYQSHGIGTMLLTRLVDAARAHGIDRMTAEVLAQNTLMLEVIRDRGWAPDVAATTRHNIAAAERRILLDAARSDLRTSADGDRRGGTR